MKLDHSISAIVTGGASGLGEATARALAAHGVKVAIFDLNAQSGQALADAIGGVFCPCDVSDEASVDAAFASARAAHGQERILINCAGLLHAAKTASRERDSGRTRHFPLDAFERTIQVNLIGTFRCMAQSAQGMLDLTALEDGERGIIINTSSIAAHDGQIGQAAYAASKGAVASLTLPVARDLMDEGIRVNGILPGIFATPMMARASDAVRQSLAAGIPFPKRFGHPDEFAALALSIISNPYLNGENIRLDAAIRMPPR